MKTIILIALLSIMFIACGSSDAAVGITPTFTFNDEAVTLTADDFRYHKDVIYLSTDLLDTQMHLGLQELVPDQQIGICTDALCIPYELYVMETGEGTDDGTTAIKDGGKFYIPVVNLMDNLGAKSKWDNSTHTLDVQYTLHDTE